MFVCERNSASVGLANNTITSIKLPSLSRTYVSFHYICGYVQPTSGNDPYNCSIDFGIIAEIEDTTYIEQIFHDIPTNDLVNNGSLGQVADWFHKRIQLPILPDGRRIRVISSFDNQHGGFGMDNIHISTPQMYVLI